MVPLKRGDDSTLVQTVAFSFKVNANHMQLTLLAGISSAAFVQATAFSHRRRCQMNEVGGADENLAAFRSENSGKDFTFQQVIALKNATMPPNLPSVS